MKFKDVAHLYIGCRIVEKDGTLRLLTGSFYHYTMTGLDFYPFEGWKPILRRLKDLTDEQREETGLVGLIHERWTKSKTAYKDLRVTPETWLKLLSWGYDLFGLIDSGKAIDAKTLEQAL